MVKAKSPSKKVATATKVVSKKTPVNKAVKKLSNKQAFANALILKEKALEAKGGPKTKQEKSLEKAITKLTGKPYKGKR